MSGGEMLVMLVNLRYPLMVGMIASIHVGTQCVFFRSAPTFTGQTRVIESANMSAQGKRPSHTIATTATGPTIAVMIEKLFLRHQFPKDQALQVKKTHLSLFRQAQDLMSSINQLMISRLQELPSTLPLICQLTTLLIPFRLQSISKSRPGG